MDDERDDRVRPIKYPVFRMRCWSCGAPVLTKTVHLPCPACLEVRRLGWSSDAGQSVQRRW